MRPSILLGILAIGVLFYSACSTKRLGENEEANLIVVNAPVAGEVRRILVSENIAVDANAPIIEIAVRRAAADRSNRNLPPRPGQNQRNNIEEAQREVERTSIEVARVEKLVISKTVPQSQLDAARADFQKAQERLLLLQKSTDHQVNNQSTVNRTVATEQPDETIVSVRAPTGGVVRIIGVKRGQIITAGQPLATISTNDK
jgi:multidrug resistance efflux pump